MRFTTPLSKSEWPTVDGPHVSDILKQRKRFVAQTAILRESPN